MSAVAAFSYHATLPGSRPRRLLGEIRPLFVIFEVNNGD